MIASGLVPKTNITFFLFISYLLLANAGIDEAEFLEFLAVVDVAAIDDDVTCHDFLDDIPAGHAELAPLGHQRKDIGTVSGIVHVLAVGDAVADATAALIHGNGVEDADGGTIFQEAVDDHQGRGLAHIVGLGLEREADDSDSLARETADGREHLIIDNRLLALVDTLDSLDDFHMIAIVETGMEEGLGILGEAGTAIATASIEELSADTGIGAYALADTIDIGADTLAEVGNVVHERDAGGKHGIGGILGHLGRGDIHEDDTEIVD